MLNRTAWPDAHLARKYPYYVCAPDERLFILRAQTLDDAIDEAARLDPVKVGQIVDVRQAGRPDAVAESIDVTG